MDDLLLAFYGDDFTGSTDALEGLARNGVRTVLFTDPPDPDDIDRFGGLDAVGVAGRSRSMSPAEMDEALPDVFEDLRAIDPPVVHYKVCSTFDSAPAVGSIGRAIDLAQAVYDSPFVPVSQATMVPNDRYVAFGNLFAAQDETVYRIDRHPTMSEHPTTPMHESDLQHHLGEQTDREIGLVDATELEADDGVSLPDEEIVVFDGLSEEHLRTIGRVVWERATVGDGPLFVVGSSGLEHHALTNRWKRTGAIEGQESLLEPRSTVDRLLVISGSASPMTAAQIDWATGNGFEAVRLDTPSLVDSETAPAARERAVSDALRTLERGDSAVLYSARGPDDPVIGRTNRRLAEADSHETIGAQLGEQQGRILRRVLEETDLSRVCVAGGDTSGYVLPELDTYALEPLARTAPGAPLCRVHSRRSAFDGLEITLKGGQTGFEGYFGLVREGGITE